MVQNVPLSEKFIKIKNVFSINDYISKLAEPPGVGRIRDKNNAWKNYKIYKKKQF